MNRRNDINDFDDDDDEDFRPTSRSGTDRSSRTDSDDDEAKPRPKRLIRRGWAAAEQIKESKSDYAQTLKLSDDPQLIKFLEDEPYASYRTHWVDRSGQKSWVCIDDSEPKGCPLCEVGNRSSQRFSFNVVLLSEGADPVIKSFDVGVRVLDQLKNFHTDQRQGPLSKNYWAVSRTGKGTSSATSLQMIRERDLDDDFGVEALTPSDLADLRRRAYTEDIVQVSSRKELLEIAEELG